MSRTIIPPSLRISADPLAFSDSFFEEAIRHYVKRRTDSLALSLAESAGGETLVIRGQRQMGKSLLMRRYLTESHGRKRQAVVDMARIAEDRAVSLASLLEYLAETLAYCLCPPEQLPAVPALRIPQDLTSFIEQKLLSGLDSPVVIALDHVDIVLGREYQRDFFAMLRSWHDARAKPDSRWAEADLVLASSTEPYLLIPDPSLSPFSVGTVVTLEPLTLRQCYDLNRTYDEQALATQDVEKLWQLLHGHPHLTRLAYYALIYQQQLSSDVDALVEGATDPESPFHEHLNELWEDLRKSDSLVRELEELLRKGKVPSDEAFQRLYAAGLVRREHGRIALANQLYARFFEEVL